MKKILFIAIRLLLIVIIIFSIYKLINKSIAYKEADKTYEKVSEIHKNSLNEEDRSLIKDNNDYKFFITVENTNIDYPVVQGSNNEYYLTHDFYNKESISGCIFLDYKSKVESDNNLILYGHNMRNNTMFQQLENFKDKNFFNQNNKILIKTNNNLYTYEVFSVYVATTIDKIETNFISKKNLLDYEKLSTEKSLNKSNVVVNEDDKILTLVTCSYEYKEARTILVAKLLKK